MERIKKRGRGAPRKDKDTQNKVFRFDTDVLKRIDEIAQQECVSQNKFLIDLCKKTIWIFDQNKKYKAELMQKIYKYAEKENRTADNFIESVLIKYIEEIEKKQNYEKAATTNGD